MFKTFLPWQSMVVAARESKRATSSILAEKKAAEPSAAALVNRCFVFGKDCTERRLRVSR
jgi:hypothetical protein